MVELLAYHAHGRRRMAPALASCREIHLLIDPRGRLGMGAVLRRPKKGLQAISLSIVEGHGVAGDPACGDMGPRFALERARDVLLARRLPDGVERIVIGGMEAERRGVPLIEDVEEAGKHLLKPVEVQSLLGRLLQELPHALVEHLGRKPFRHDEILDCDHTARRTGVAFESCGRMGSDILSKSIFKAC